MPVSRFAPKKKSRFDPNELDIPEFRAAPSPHETRYRPPLTETERAKAVVDLVRGKEYKPTPLERITRFAEKHKPVTETALFPLGKLLDVTRGVVGAVEPKTTLKETLISSAKRGFLRPETVPPIGVAALKAYPKLDWRVAGTLGTLAEAGTFLGGMRALKGVRDIVSETVKSLSPQQLASKGASEISKGLLKNPRYNAIIEQVAREKGLPKEEAHTFITREVWKSLRKTPYMKRLNIALGKAGRLKLPQNIIQKYKLTSTQISNIEKGIYTGIPAKAVEEIARLKPPTKAPEFKVGDILDPQGKTNMVGRVTIREIKGNTLKFTDSEGTEFAGMQRSLVRDLIRGGSWKKVTPPTPTKAPEVAPPIEPPPRLLPPAEPPKFPGISEAFLRQPKKRVSIVQYIKPAEYQLKELGFEEKIAQPVREALQDFSIELQGKSKFVSQIQTEHHKTVPLTQKKASDLKVWNYMDKGIPKDDVSIEAQIARKYRPETEEMLRRLNEVRKEIGKDEIRGVKNYILHSLKPEVLNEIYARGVIPSELAKVMEYIPPKNLFLRTAEQRQGVPEEWLVKNPHQLMRMMYAIDLKYIHLQRALAKIDPYLKAVKEYKDVTPQGKVDEWTPETYKYLDDWIKQAIKMRPSNWDTLIDNLVEHTLAPLLRKTGMKVSHMPWRDFVSTMSAAAHTGALGMRVRPILRNLVQSTFDWVMYGTNPYLKGSKAFLTKEGREILKKSKVWRTRVPFEAQDIATLGKLFKVGALGYRASDLHNVGKGLLTRYYHAVDNLKMSPERAIKWADQDLPATQWSYRREDLPRAYWTTTGRAFWTLGSWWMNFYTRFLPEILRRGFTGKDVMGRVVPTSERLGVMRLLILIGTLYGVKEYSKELTGTTIDYTGQVQPTPLRHAPIAQMLLSLKDLAQGLTDKDDRKTKGALRNLSRTSKIFIPWWLAGQDLFRYVTGERTLGETLFYGKRAKKPKVKSRFAPSQTRKRKSRFAP